MNDKCEKYTVSFESEAQKKPDGLIVVAESGVRLVCENEQHSPLFLEAGKRYKITIEEV